MVIPEQNFVKKDKSSVFLSKRIESKGNNYVIKSAEGNIIYPCEEDKLPLSLFKFIRHEHSKLSLFNKQYLTFVSPECWEDPFEYASFDEYNLDEGDRLFCFCTTVSRSHGEESFWRRYDPTCEGNYVMWSLDFVKLINALSNVSKRKKVTFYIALIDYSFNKETVRQILNIKPTSTLQQIEQLCIKRKAFAHENEARIFAVINQDSKIKNDGYFLRVPLTLAKPINNGEKINRKDLGKNSILQKIVLPPYKPGHKGQFADHEYAVLQHIFNDNKRKFYEKFDIKIEQCGLYEVNYLDTSTILNKSSKIKI